MDCGANRSPASRHCRGTQRKCCHGGLQLRRPGIDRYSRRAACCKRNVARILRRDRVVAGREVYASADAAICQRQSGERCSCARHKFHSAGRGPGPARRINLNGHAVETASRQCGSTQRKHRDRSFQWRSGNDGDRRRTTRIESVTARIVGNDFIVRRRGGQGDGSGCCAIRPERDRSQRRTCACHEGNIAGGSRGP
jgi:hypothetical protein